MKKMKTILRLSIVIVLLIFIGCAQSPTKPSANDIAFVINIHYGENPDGSLAKKAGNNSGLSKPATIQQYNMARIMVLDFSKYGDWQGFLQSADAAEYYADLDAWTGDRDSWAEWKGFFGNYFNIASDQTLEIGVELATGTVTGVIGHNHFFMAFTEGDLIEFQGEGSADGVAGETVDVTITFDWDQDDNWDDWWWDDPPEDW